MSDYLDQLRRLAELGNQSGRERLDMRLVDPLLVEAAESIDFSALADYVAKLEAERDGIPGDKKVVPPEEQEAIGSAMHELEHERDMTIAERDALAAQVGGLREALVMADRYMTERGVSHEYPVLRNARAAIQSTPTSALARLRAEAKMEALRNAAKRIEAEIPQQDDSDCATEREIVRQLLIEAAAIEGGKEIT